ncbi:hypothetical protein [Streptomyces tagetis]|uniref:Abi-like protein n=1 Tax=Streptomyces tagetis TaxID=2820809 RepID=A0A941B125_9ACTN|nr:hypothetical protein [Streptomyces sp. RG38]MBQ0830814.1 hypothetical protein [Streptomyces sp. RG38]
MAGDLPEWMLRAFSKPRMASYLRAARGDAQKAASLYWWNMEASAALYGPLNCLEVTLRNALHGVLEQHHGRPDWWVGAPLSPNGLRLVDDARAKCERNGTASAPVDGIVTELTLGFWVSLVSGARGYDRGFWVPATHKAFPNYSGRRKELHDSLMFLLWLRNRVMHHEPIDHQCRRRCPRWHLDPVSGHATLYDVLGYLSPELAKEARAMDRFPAVFASRGDALRGTRPPQF